MNSRANRVASLAAIAVKALNEEKFDHKCWSRMWTSRIDSIYYATQLEKIAGLNDLKNEV